MKITCTIGVDVSYPSIGKVARGEHPGDRIAPIVLIRIDDC